MQEAHASCDGGRSGPSGTLPISSQSFFPHCLSFSLELFNRFAKDNEFMDSSICIPKDFHEIDIEATDATSGMPPPPGGWCHHFPCFFVLMLDGLLRRAIRTLRLSWRIRVSANLQASSASAAKKPTSAESVIPSNISSRDAAQAGSASFVTSTSTSVSISYRYNSKDKPLFIVQIHSILEFAPFDPIHI